MFTCKNPQKHVHQHATSIEARVCWGLLPAYAPAAPVSPPATSAPAIVPPTPSQLRFVEALDGDVTYAYKLSKAECSRYIDLLKKGKAPVTAAPPPPKPVDPRLDLLKGMFSMVPDGYYAVQEFEGGHVTFLRVSSPKNGRFAGSRKVQTAHGTGMSNTVRLEEAAALWPSGKWSFYKVERTMVDALMLLVADHQTAAMRYGDKLERCLRCNAPLTDDTSRHYRLGTDCIKLRPDIVELVNLRDEEKRLGL